jgi:hypothetical protein
LRIVRECIAKGQAQIRLCEIDVLALSLVKSDVIAMVVNVVGSHDVEIRFFAGSAGHVPPANPWQIAGYNNDFSLGKRQDTSLYCEGLP